MGEKGGEEMGHGRRRGEGETERGEWRRGERTDERGG
jgi:hypothetical protein